MMNQNTRAMYDDTTARNRNVITQQSMKYIVHDMTDNMRASGTHAESIDANSELRMKPTRLNQFNRPETQLYGTAPFKGLGHESLVDIDTALRDGDISDMRNRHMSERMWDTNDYINEPLQVDTDIRSASTRADLRNSYCKVSGRAVNKETHIMR